LSAALIEFFPTSTTTSIENIIIAMVLEKLKLSMLAQLLSMLLEDKPLDNTFKLHMVKHPQLFLEPITDFKSLILSHQFGLPNSDSHHSPLLEEPVEPEELDLLLA
jgi:hypothetical protein